MRNYIRTTWTVIVRKIVFDSRSESLILRRDDCPQANTHVLIIVQPTNNHHGGSGTFDARFEF